jgi:F1F0 ATPase subunit 2
MNEILLMLLTLLAGLLLGAIFFGGLWISVQRALASKQPAVWFAGSLISRLTITLFGFYFVAQGNWQRLLICLLGFIAARFIVLRYTKGIEEKRNEIKGGALNET